jgi:hypothetical protein
LVMAFSKTLTNRTATVGRGSYWGLIELSCELVGELR